jgi:hypothetical protein
MNRELKIISLMRSRPFFDPAPPRFAAKAKLALCAQTVALADASLRGQGAPKKSQFALQGV